MNTKSLLLIAALLASGAAQAVTASNTFQVTATVISSCTVSGTALNFGNTIDPLAAAVPLDATSTLSVTCSNTTPYTVALNAGSNAGGASNFSARAMKAGSRSLAYQLYLDTGRSSVWGDGTASSATVAGTGTGSVQTLSIYGRLPSLANVAPGAYTDTVTVTITY
ncbi:spore coat U domain-containing protein [Paucibacter sp. R3-3]|uniref:Spore coat U domain-containing protein n=1 Tax=Roseateles agri TaxID=3098619 RepID=A0ABU5D9P0_9BURK|nr:spore coat U domain-containing protein [Paucibacter sp. R3-3]MDY0743006.1 spore coat U domain-containing protein [Paucibacter sp. R3-3]